MNIHSVPADASPMTERILDAALAVFTERTFGGAAVPLIAERAGVSVGSLYRSFSGKEEMANAVYRRAKTRMLAAVTEAVADAGPEAGTQGAVLAAWAGLAAYAAADPDGFAFLEHQQHAAYLDDESRAVARRIDDLAAGIVREGQKRGDVRDGSPDQLVALVFGAFVGLSKAARATGRPLRAADIDSSGQAVWALLARADHPSTTAKAAVTTKKRTS